MHILCIYNTFRNMQFMHILGHSLKCSEFMFFVQKYSAFALLMLRYFVLFLYFLNFIRYFTYFYKLLHEQSEYKHLNLYFLLFHIIYILSISTPILFYVIYFHLYLQDESFFCNGNFPFSTHPFLILMNIHYIFWKF